MNRLSRVLAWSSLALLGLFAACAHSPDCQKRISDCLANCPPSEPRSELPPGAAGREARERRSDCERRCDMLCGPTPRGGVEAPIEPATGPFVPPDNSPPGSEGTPPPADAPDDTEGPAPSDDAGRAAAHDDTAHSDATGRP